MHGRLFVYNKLCEYVRKFAHAQSHFNCPKIGAHCVLICTMPLCNTVNRSAMCMCFSYWTLNGQCSIQFPTFHFGLTFFHQKREGRVVSGPIALCLDLPLIRRIAMKLDRLSIQYESVISPA